MTAWNNILRVEVHTFLKQNYSYSQYLIPVFYSAAFVMIVLSQFGSVVGAHRMWSHNSFKPTLPLKVFLLFCQTLSTQGSAFHWARLHRVHHKYVDTSKDPYNANAGFFFSHIGWLLVQPNPETREAVSKVWMDDLKKDRLVMFQHK